MSFLSKFVRAVQSWRRRRGAIRSRNRADFGLEQLDHRQLLSVNFTGSVATDFPVTQSPGVVYVSDPQNQIPIIPSVLQTPVNLVPVSGFQIDKVAVNYDSTTDTLSVGFLQPPSQINAYPVIAGDADDNGNNSTVNPAINNGMGGGVEPGLQDNPGISGGEYMAAVLDLSGGTNSAAQTVIAGIPISDPTHPNSTFLVGQALFSGGVPDGRAGTEFPQFEGNIYVPSNDPRHGALELSITHFSQLYLQETGHALTSQSVISLGALAGSGNDDGISEEVFHAQPFPLSQATTPLPPPPPPPIPCIASPPVLINPHQNRHVNTAHYDNVRVTVLSSSGFDATQINPATVRFGGAAPIAEFSRIQLHDGFESETFVFKGTDITLPPGITEAPITGTTYGGQQFSSSELIFNRDDSFYSPARIAGRDARLARIGITSIAQEQAAAATATQATSAQAMIASQSAQMTTAGSVAATPDVATSSVATPTTIKITPRQAAIARTEARKEALMSTVAARSFQSPSATTYPVATTTPASSSLLAHDLALQSLASQSAPSAV